MRTLLALAALVAPTVAAVSVQDADACGPYRPMPIAWEVEHHGWGQDDRQFVVFGSVGEGAEMAKGEKEWGRIVPGRSFDHAEFAVGQKLERAMGITLLTLDGSSTYTTAASFGLIRDHDGLHSAVEIEQPKSYFVIALRGKREDAKLTALGFDERGAQTIEGTGYSLQTEELEGKRVRVLRNNGELVQALDGVPLGVLTAKEGTFLAVRESWGVNLVEI